MSLLAKTEQRPAMRGTWTLRMAISPHSSSIETPRRDACWSRNEPVPAAHSVFMAKSRIRRRPVIGSSSSRISFESSPPISMIVRTSGCSAPVALACATTSLTGLILYSSPRTAVPAPAKATPSISDGDTSANRSSSAASAVSSGLPRVRM